MIDDFSVDGQSRLFRVAVICLGITVLTSALVGVGSLATNPDAGLVDSSTDDREEFLFNFDEEEPPDAETGDANNERESDESTIFDYLTGSQQESDGTGNNDDNDNGGDSADSSADDNTFFEPDSTDSRIPEFLDAGNFETSSPSRSHEEAGERQLDTMSSESLLNERHFTVDSFASSESSSLWRTTGYDSYRSETMVNSELESSDSDALREVPMGMSGEDSSAVNTITFDSETSKIPSSSGVSAVEIVSGADEQEYSFKQTSDGSVVVFDGDGSEVKALPEGSTIHVESSQNDNGHLSKSESVETYTTVPNTVPDRVGEQSRDIVSSSGAETNREKADEISAWLQSNTGYQVGVTRPEGSDRVDDFVFESQAGDSDDFAIATTMLLREQGVPTRVASGYKQSSADQNELGSMDQHTWVEVYDDEQEQWVAYDPTPNTRDELRERTRSGDSTVSDDGVHEDVVRAWNDTTSASEHGEDETNSNSVTYSDERSDERGTTETETPDSSGSTDGSGVSEGVDVRDVSPPFDIVVSPDPTPGGTVTVTVLKNENPVSGARVTFNGELVGVSDSEGQITAQVPYDKQLTVSVGEPEPETKSESSIDGGVVGGGAFSSGNQSSETFTLPTNINFESSDVVIPGESVSGKVVVNENPVPNVAVYIDGEFVGETNTDGEIRVTIPETVDFGDVVVMGVERDAFSSEKRIVTGEPEIRADDSVFSLPFSQVEFSVIVTDDVNEKVLEHQDVEIVDGSGDPVLSERTVNTGENGSVSVSIPVSNSVTASSAVSGVSVEHTISGILYRVGVLLGVVGVVIGVVGREARRRGVTLSNLVNVCRQLFIRIGEWCVKTGEKAHAWVVYTKQRVVQLGVWGYRLVTNRDFKGVLLVPEKLLWRVVTVIGLAREFVWKKSRRVWDWVLRNSTTGSELQDDGETNDSAGGSSRSEAERLVLMWEWFVRQVLHRSGASHKTSVEIAEEGIRKGLPMKPVVRLRKAFQNVKYGLKDASENVDAGDEAVSSIKSVTETSTDTDVNIDSELSGE